MLIHTYVEYIVGLSSELCAMYSCSRTGSGQLSLWSLSTKRQTWTETCPASVVSISRVTRDTLAVWDDLYLYTLICELCTTQSTVDVSTCSQLSGGTVTLWSLEAHKQVSSFSIQNPSFCRLSLFPHAGRPFQWEYWVVHTCIHHDVSILPVDSSALLNPNCFAVADANWGKVS